MNKKKTKPNQVKEIALDQSVTK